MQKFLRSAFFTLITQKIYSVLVILLLFNLVEFKCSISLDDVLLQIERGLISDTTDWLYLPVESKY